MFDFKNNEFKKGALQKKGGFIWGVLTGALLPLYTLNRKKTKGQALTEALAFLPITSACFIVSFGLFFAYTQKIWMDHQLYQSLICLAQGENKTHCKQKMKKKIKIFLWTGKLKNIQLHKKTQQWKGTFTWETHFWKIPFQQTLNKGSLSL